MHDIVIIGAGPAGLSAAIACQKFQLNTVILDEFPKAGGRLLGQLHEEPTGEWWNGIEEANNLTSRLADNVLCGVSVHHIEQTDDHFIVHTNKGLFPGEKVLIATGAAETAIPIPGWTLPGVMSIGAAQVMTNVHRVRVGDKGLIVGVNVLSAAIARELQLAGVEPICMALPAYNQVTDEQSNPYKVMERLVDIAHLAPSIIIKFGSKFAKSRFIQRLAVKFFPSNGVKMWGMPIHLRKAITEIHGTEKVEAVTIAKITANGDVIRGSEKQLAVDYVCIAGGLYPLAELAAVVGCPFEYVESLGGHVPVHNNAMETPISGIYVAGNITGIESAKVAREQGTVAGLSIVQSFGHNTKDELNKAIIRVSATRDAATIQFHPDVRDGRSQIEKSFETSKI